MTLSSFDTRYRIKSAMMNRQLIEFIYDNRYVVGEPHAYGIKVDEIRLLVYQISGQNDARLPCWHDVLVERISNLRLLGYHFQGKRMNARDLRKRFEMILEIVT